MTLLFVGGSIGVAEVLRRARAGADAVRHAGGGRGRLGAEHHLSALHSHKQTGRVVLAGELMFLRYSNVVFIQDEYLKCVQCV